MAFMDLPGGGKIYVPDALLVAGKKHPCADCYFCQFCDDARCAQCARCLKKKRGGNKNGGSNAEKC